MNGRLAARANGSIAGRESMTISFITRLQLASHRAHWVKMTQNTQTDEPDLHEFKGVENFLETLTT